MKMKKIVLIIVVLMAIIVSGVVGYVTAYVEGLQKVNDMNVRTMCYVLRLQSLILLRKSTSSDVASLADVIENNCDGWASFIRVNEPYCSADTKKMITETLSAWEDASTKLKEIKASNVK